MGFRGSFKGLGSRIAFRRAFMVEVGFLQSVLVRVCKRQQGPGICERLGGWGGGLGSITRKGLFEITRG